MPYIKNPTSKILSAVTIGMFLTLPLTTVGCATNSISKNKVADTKTQRQRKNLVGNLEKVFDVDMMIKSTTKNIPDQSVELKKCISSKKTTTKVNKNLNQILTESVDKLNNAEVEEYLNYLNNDGFIALQKFHALHKTGVIELIRGKSKSGSQEIINLLPDLSKQEKSALRDVEKLPNKTLRNLLIPKSKSDDEMINAIIYVSIGTAVQNNCMQYFQNNNYLK